MSSVLESGAAAAAATRFERPFVIDVEGVIGAGKSTLIERGLVPALTERGWRVTVVREPVEQWREILPRFYADPHRWAFTFQVKAFRDRVHEARQKWERYHDHTDIFITERGVISDAIFMDTLHAQQLVTDMEHTIYHEQWSQWEAVMPFRPDLFVYLTPSMDEVMRRVRARARAGEEGVSLEYQTLLARRHDEYFGEESDACLLSNTHSVPVHRLRTDSNFRDDAAVQHTLVAELERKIVDMYHNRRRGGGGSARV